MAATTACGVDENPKRGGDTVGVEATWVTTASSTEKPADELAAGSEGISKWMKPEIYLAASRGDGEFLGQLADDPEFEVSDEVSPGGRTILHVAIAAGADQELVASILRRSPNLLNVPDHAGDTALHLAARAGHVPATGALIRFMKERQPEASWFSYLLQTNHKTGNTAVHAALQIGRSHGCDRVARLLVEECPSELWLNRLNKADESPLYLAAIAGNLEMVKLLLEMAVAEHEVAGKSIVHAAIKSRNTDVLDAILSKWQGLFKSLYEDGRTPLSFAARTGNHDAVLHILEKFPDSAYRRDSTDEGFFPIHTAARGGHEKIIREILRRCPDAWELLTHKKQNFLHVAAWKGKSRIVKCVLERSKDEIGMSKLVNDGDGNGDSPLHLAVKYWHPMVVSILTWDKRVQLSAVNDDGLTASDICVKLRPDRPSFRQGLTLAALRSAGVPRSERLTPGQETTAPDTPKQQSISEEPLKEWASTLLLVATLVATVTFTCGFTIPGGTNSNSGMATLLTKHMFHVFLICNAIALNSSIFAVVVLIAAQLKNTRITMMTLLVAMPLIGIALSAMSIAFTAGVYLVVRHLRWVTIFIFVVGLVFTSLLAALYLQYFVPVDSTNRVLRYLSYPSFRFYLWAAGSNEDASDE